jgi:signal peptidase I
MRILKRKSVALLELTILVVMAITPAYLRIFVVAGDSDAPAYITGDKVLINFAAYDLRIPYGTRRLVRLADPLPGDVVLFRLADGQLGMKRIAAVPGTRIAFHGNHMVINGTALTYTSVQSEDEARIRRGRLGPVIQVEGGNGPNVYVSFDPAHADRGDLTEYSVPDDSYFVLGSNRDVSVDSRHFGALPRDCILGKVVARL